VLSATLMTPANFFLFIPIHNILSYQPTTAD